MRGNPLRCNNLNKQLHVEKDNIITYFLHYSLINEYKITEALTT